MEVGLGLRGLADRVEALGGRLRVESQLGEGTVVSAQLPLD
jgi:signal transduction histidine kinase